MRERKGGRRGGGGGRGAVSVVFVGQEKRARYLLVVGQKFAELCELLCAITVPDTLPDILNYLLSGPAGKITRFCYDIIVKRGFQHQERYQHCV